MPRFWRSLPLALLLALAQAATAEADCSLLLLAEQGDEIAIEPTIFHDGESREIALRPSSRVVTFILPFGEGKSADLVRSSDVGSVAASCKGDALTLAVRRANGAVRALPPVAHSELAALDLRVNLKRGDGLERAFSVTGYSTVRPASGPVLDLFGGRLPLAPGDWAITLEATAHRGAALVAGEASLRFDGEHLFAEARLPDGRRGRFVIDTAAASCVLARAFLPAGTEVARLAAEAHGGGDAAEVSEQAVGLGGAVAGETLRATLSRLEVGTLAFDEVEVTVLDSLPQIGGQEIAGILGLDLLRRARAVEISFENGEAAHLRARATPRAQGDAVAFSLADRHLFLAGESGGRPSTWVVDTGAKVSLVGAALARELGIVAVPGATVELRGLDRTTTFATRGRAARLRLGAAEFEAVDFAILPELAALRAWGLEPRAAILGNDFWRRFRALEFDFEKQLLYLERR